MSTVWRSFAFGLDGWTRWSSSHQRHTATESLEYVFEVGVLIKDDVVKMTEADETDRADQRCPSTKPRSEPLGSNRVGERGALCKSAIPVEVGCGRTAAAVAFFLFFFFASPSTGRLDKEELEVLAFV